MAKVLGIGPVRKLSREVVRAGRSQRASLMFGLGMSNNGTGWWPGAWTCCWAEQTPGKRADVACRGEPPHGRAEGR